MFVHDAILEALTCGDTQIDTNIFKKKIKEMNQCNPQTHLTEFETQFRVCTARSEEKTLFPLTRCWKKCLLNQMRSLGARL